MKTATGISGRKKLVDHDFVSALYTIQGLAESQLEASEKDGVDRKELLDGAHEALSTTMNHATKVIEMIHYFRKVAFTETKKTESVCSTSVHDAVRDILRAMSYEFPFKNITVLKILPHTLSPVPIPREHLETILFQLIYNARRAIGKGPGMITVEAPEIREPQARQNAGRSFSLRVTDTGPGIDPADLPHLFDPFFSESRSGNGLGLYIVKKLSELNNGTVRAESSDKGTSFYLDFILS